MKTRLSFISSLLIAINLISVGLSAQEVRYSDRIIERPGIMPVGIINFDTNISLKKFNGAENKNLRTLNVDLATQFGIVRNLHGEISWGGLDFNDFKANKSVTLATKYQYLSLPHTALSAKVSLPVHIYDGEIIREITFGLPSVFYTDHVVGGILHNLFTLTMRDNIKTTFKFPVWFGAQVYDKWWAAIDSSFGVIHSEKVNGTMKTESTPFWEVLPLNMQVAYVVNHCFDIGANFGFEDTFKAKDTMKIGLLFSFRAGRLFG